MFFWAPEGQVPNFDILGNVSFFDIPPRPTMSRDPDTETDLVTQSKSESEPDTEIKMFFVECKVFTIKSTVR